MLHPVCVEGLDKYMWPKQIKPWKVLTVVSISVVVGALTCCALLHSVCDMKTTKLNIQCCLIKQLRLCKFELGHNATEATKTICCTKGAVAVDNKWLQKFCMSCKNLDDQSKDSKNCAPRQRQIQQLVLR